MRIYATILESSIIHQGSNKLVDVIYSVVMSGLIESLNNEIASNPNFENISLASISISIITKQIDVTDVDEEKRAEFAENIANAISFIRTHGYGSMDEKLLELSALAKEYFTKFGIGLSNQTTIIACDVLYNHFGVDEDEISREEIEDFFNSLKSE